MGQNAPEGCVCVQANALTVSSAQLRQSRALIESNPLTDRHLNAPRDLAASDTTCTHIHRHREISAHLAFWLLLAAYMCRLPSFYASLLLDLSLFLRGDLPVPILGSQQTNPTPKTLHSLRLRASSLIAGGRGGG